MKITADLERWLRLRTKAQRNTSMRPEQHAALAHLAWWVLALGTATIVLLRLIPG